MDFESSAIDQVITAITDYAGYTTTWNKTVFEVQDFDSDIPSGNIHNGICPFVAIRGGLSDDYTQIAGDLYEGTTELEIYIAISAPLIYSRASWAPIHTFTGEIERAIATLDGEGFRMSPTTSKSNPVSLNQMVNRVLTISIEGAECREATGPPVYQSNPVLSGTPKEGNTLTVTNGEVIGTEPITYSYDWLNDGISIGATDQNTYLVPAGIEGDTISCEVTASNGILPTDSAESNGLEIVAMLPPVNTVAPVLSGTPEPDEVLSCTDGTWTGEPTIVYTYAWYKAPSTVIAGETANTYTVLIGDIGEDIFCRVTGTNGVDNSSADSNSLSIVSGFIAALDGVTPAFAASPVQQLTSAYATGGLDGVNYRNGTTAATGSLGWVSNKFDVDGWDTASTSGSQSLFTTSILDQISSNDLAQVGTTLQPELLRPGQSSTDGVNDKLVSPYTLGNGDNFTIYLFTKDMGTAKFAAICQQFEGAGVRSWKISAANPGLGRFEIAYETASGSLNYTWLVPTYYDGSTYPVIAISFSSATGAICYANGVAQSLFSTTGTIDTVLTTGAKLEIIGKQDLEGFAMTHDTNSQVEIQAVVDQWDLNNV